MYHPDEECGKVLQRIRRFCEIRELSLDVLAREVGLSAASMYNLMSGKTSLQLSVLYRLCNALGISLEELTVAGVMDEGDGNHKEEAFDVRSIGRLSAHEKNLVALFRYMPERKKRMLRVYTEMLIRFDLDGYLENQR